MDKTDVILSMMLLLNSRASYRELADKLGLSVNAVHKRIQSMVDEGIIRSFTTRISLITVGGAMVWVLGQGDFVSVEDVKAKLQNNRNVYWLAVTGGDNLLVGLNMRQASELDANLRQVIKACGMKSPFVGITLFPSMMGDVEKEISPLDFRIVKALANDSRRTVVQVADELSLSAKTVRRRLERMESKGLLEYSISWYPDESNDIITLFQVFLADDADKHMVGRSLQSRNTPQVLFYHTFDNVPNQIFVITWSPTTKELKSLRERLAAESGVARLVPNIIYSGYIFPTWREQMIEEGAARAVPG